MSRRIILFVLVFLFCICDVSGYAKDKEKIWNVDVNGDGRIETIIYSETYSHPTGVWPLLTVKDNNSNEIFCQGWHKTSPHAGGYLFYDFDSHPGREILFWHWLLEEMYNDPNSNAYVYELEIYGWDDKKYARIESITVGSYRLGNSNEVKRMLDKLGDYSNAYNCLLRFLKCANANQWENAYSFCLKSDRQQIVNFRNANSDWSFSDFDFNKNNSDYMFDGCYGRGYFSFESTNLVNGKRLAISIAVGNPYKISTITLIER